ncbi:MAG TPA: S8 family serine peptidase [Candidatus Limnocylindrales bacterium]|nr:S8 family serine peptidase [Candidatus Limnocylindrales bacterium]
MRRLLTVFAVAAIAAAAAAPAAARNPSYSRDNDGLRPAGVTPSGVVHGAKSTSGRLAQSDPELLARNDGQMVNVLIKYDLDPVASFQGGKGMAATSPGITGKPLKDGGAAVARYAGYLNGQARQINGRIAGAVPRASLGRTFLTAFGGASARIPANTAKDLARVDGVAAVMYDSVQRPQTDASPAFVGADQVWPTIGGSQKAGEGVKVGIIDTGIWPEHPSFTDPGVSHPGGTYACDFGDSGDADDADFACNDKLIGAYAFLETQLEFGSVIADGYCNTADNDAIATDDCSARDADGHGTHTSSTAAGRSLATAELFGVERGPLSGIAPGAHVIHYRVCLDGCFSSDSIDAVAQSIVDDVDVINFSISGGANPYSDGVELAFLDAYAAGIMVNASAGNSGPGPATTDHGGPWVNTVGASTSDRHFLTTLMLAAGPNTLNVPGVTITAGIGSATPVVKASAAPYSNELCTAPAAPGIFAGKIVICERGTNARVEKGYNVLQGGAVGMILYNVGVTDLETDNHYLPTVHVNDAAETINAFVTANPTATATWTTGVASAVPGDVMASFSSRGPLGDFVKPDVTAPGVQILAGASPEHLDDPAEGLGPDGQLFQAIAGTSMSSPHAAGVAALIKDAHPSWTPGQIKSAMMTSSVQSVLKEDGATPANPFDRGAGSIRANRAVNPTVTFEATSAQFYAGANDSLGRINLNIPSVNAPVFAGVVETTRTARNVTAVQQTLNITTQSPPGMKITVTPKQLVLGPFQSKPIQIRIEGAELADGQYFGQITLNPKKDGYNNAVLPVAVNKTQGDVTLDHECDTPITVGSESDCEVTVTNFATSDANVSVKVKGENATALKINDFSAGNKSGNGFVWNGNLGPSLPPAVNGLDAIATGWDDLDQYIAPEPALWGDEDLVEYGLGALAVYYGDVVYDTVGVTSNGYLVFSNSGYEAADIDFIPQDMPNPVRPNNVLAPYWTDLNFDDGGDFYLAYDGCYLVFQWDAVPIWGSGGADTRSFQVWMMTADCSDFFGVPGGDDIYFDYDFADMGPGAGDDDGVIEDDGLVVGAEDALGSTGADLGVDVEPAAATGYYIDTGESLAGGSMTITYDALGKKVGTWPVRATMTSDITQGTAKDVERIEVDPL